MECCSIRNERNSAIGRADMCAFANACVVEGLCDECAFSAMEDGFEMCGRDSDLGSVRAACLDVLTACRPDLADFDFVSPWHPDEHAFDLYLGWALESKSPHLLDWLLERKPKRRSLSNREMVDILADLDFVTNDEERATWDTRACLEVLSKHMHVPMTRKVLEAAATQGHVSFIRWVMENKQEYTWKRKELTARAFRMGHLELVRVLACEAGVPFCPHEMDPRDVVRAPSETKRQYRKRKLFVEIVNNYFS
jgi:hypothetical protein